jgi:hypothetical protein
MRAADGNTGTEAVAAPRSFAQISLRIVMLILEAPWSRRAVKAALTMERKAII